MVSFHLDDGYREVYNYGKHVFQNYGVPINLAIITDAVGMVRYLTWPNIKELQTLGFEIINHTKTHRNLNTLTVTQVDSEFTLSQAVFASHGIYPSDLTYPDGQAIASVQEIAKKYFRSGRSVIKSLVNYPLKMFSLECIEADSLTMSLSQGKTYILQAHNEGKWVQFYTHKTNFSVYDSLIEYSKMLGMPILTVSQALDTLSVIMNVAETKKNEQIFDLEQNFPNPFNSITTIIFQINIPCFVSLKVYDDLGREITTLLHEEKHTGEYKVEFDASNLASGIYFMRLQTEHYGITKKLILLK